MKLSVTQENLTKALSNIGRVAASRNELAILNNILLRTDNGRLLVAATNLEIASTQYIGAKIEQPGSITIPARLMTEFIASLPSGHVELEVKDEHLHITAGKFSSVINGVVADEFPELPTVNENEAIKLDIDAAEFKKSISQTIIATSSDSTRPILTGVLWCVVDGELYLAATDGYRLAEKRVMKCRDEINAVVPASTLQEVLRSLGDDSEQLEIFFDDTQVCFRTADHEIISRLIDGKFPEYRQLIPKAAETIATIQKADFSRITKVASLFARDSGGGVTVSAERTGRVMIHSIASELGENTSEASATVSSDGTITLNSRYLIEALSAIDGSEITFSFNGKLSPCVLKDTAKNPDYIHIIMPMKS